MSTVEKKNGFEGVDYKQVIRQRKEVMICQRYRDNCQWYEKVEQVTKILDLLCDLEISCRWTQKLQRDEFVWFPLDLGGHFIPIEIERSELQHIRKQFGRVVVEGKSALSEYEIEKGSGDEYKVWVLVKVHSKDLGKDLFFKYKKELSGKEKCRIVEEVVVSRTRNLVCER